MIASLLSEIFKHVIVPLGVLYVAANYLGDFIDFQTSFLITNVILSISTIPLLLWQIIKLIPSLALLKGEAILKIVLRSIIQVGSVIGFWVVFVMMFY